jgi:peroxin-1
LIPVALAKECNYQLVICKGPEILDKYIGASESRVRELFKRAKDIAPSLMFFDDIDSLAPKRGSDQTGVTDRIVNQLLTFLDGAEDITNGEIVYIISASSRPDKIDPALLRPGRLEKHIYVGYPETSEEWTDLFLKVSRNFDLTSNFLASTRSGTVYSTLSLAGIPLQLYSGADIKAILSSARLLAVRKILNDKSKLERAQIDLNEVLTAFSEAKPSLSHEDSLFLSRLYSPFRHIKLAPDSCDTAHSLRVAFL